MTATNRVTAEALRLMRMGQSKKFGPMTASQINSGKAMAYQMSRVLGCSFSATADYDKHTLTLKKQEKL